jgi:hypothetical protein
MTPENIDNLIALAAFVAVLVALVFLTKEKK